MRCGQVLTPAGGESELSGTSTSGLTYLANQETSWHYGHERKGREKLGQVARRVLRDKQHDAYVALTITILALLVAISAQLYVAVTPPPPITNPQEIQAYLEQIRAVSVLASIALLISLIFLIVAVGLLTSSLSYVQEAALSSNGSPEWMPADQRLLPAYTKPHGDIPEQIVAPPPATPAWHFTRVEVVMFIVIFIIAFLISWYISTLLFRGG